ncbi:hypothetical protein [Streptomyces sp. NPDC001820]|uniref:hypothetical protein n=1 Tax=Streptomyces sp. NPDC001820 TaxID=3364613 RepID=UPI003691798F
MTMRVGAGALAAAALLLAGAIAGCDSGTDKADADGKNTARPSATGAAPGKAAPGEPSLPAALTGQQLDFKRCKAPVKARGSYAQAPGGQWQCALLKAPLDYRKPTGETIGIALIRAKALDGDRRIGSLLFNFGGPGGSGVAGLPGAGEVLPDSRPA